MERGICPITALYLLRLTLVSYHFTAAADPNNNNTQPYIIVSNIVDHVTVRLAVYGFLHLTVGLAL